MTFDDVYTATSAQVAADHKRMTAGNYYSAGIIDELHRLHPEVGALHAAWQALDDAGRQAHAEANPVPQPFDLMSYRQPPEYVPSDETRAAYHAYDAALRRIGADRELVSTSEAAALLGLRSPSDAGRTLRRWGLLPTSRQPGQSGENLWDAADVTTAIANRPGQGRRTDLPRAHTGQGDAEQGN